MADSVYPELPQEVPLDGWDPEAELANFGPPPSDIPMADEMMLQGWDPEAELGMAPSQEQQILEQYAREEIPLSDISGPEQMGSEQTISAGPPTVEESPPIPPLDLFLLRLGRSLANASPEEVRQALVRYGFPENRVAINPDGRVVLTKDTGDGKFVQIPFDPKGFDAGDIPDLAGTGARLGTYAAGATGGPVTGALAAGFGDAALQFMGRDILQQPFSENAANYDLASSVIEGASGPVGTELGGPILKGLKGAAASSAEKLSYNAGELARRVTPQRWQNLPSGLQKKIIKTKNQLAAALLVSEKDAKPLLSSGKLAKANIDRAVDTVATEAPHVFAANDALSLGENLIKEADTVGAQVRTSLSREMLPSLPEKFSIDTPILSSKGKNLGTLQDFFESVGKSKVGGEAYENYQALQARIRDDVARAVDPDYIPTSYREALDSARMGEAELSRQLERAQIRLSKLENSALPDISKTSAARETLEGLQEKLLAAQSATNQVEKQIARENEYYRQLGGNPLERLWKLRTELDDEIYGRIQRRKIPTEGAFEAELPAYRDALENSVRSLVEHFDGNVAGYEQKKGLYKSLTLLMEGANRLNPEARRLALISNPGILTRLGVAGAVGAAGAWGAYKAGESPYAGGATGALSGFAFRELLRGGARTYNKLLNANLPSKNELLNAALNKGQAAELLLPRTFDKPSRVFDFISRASEFVSSNKAIQQQISAISGKSYLDYINQDLMEAATDKEKLKSEALMWSTQFPELFEPSKSGAMSEIDGKILDPAEQEQFNAALSDKYQRDITAAKLGKKSLLSVYDEWKRANSILE